MATDDKKVEPTAAPMPAVERVLEKPSNVVNTTHSKLPQYFHDGSRICEMRLMCKGEQIVFGYIFATEIIALCKRDELALRGILEALDGMRQEFLKNVGMC